ncbi:multiple C2 and transmembrane domain-containing protein 1 isoform X2 [Hypomesus transpacificus]|uniref:multiple C2 and transmembrane domain-containing protein 1 isoform X2 n=1 Tax=Hypomesus transpacificus TaxID=137520 RepID=UPI001F080015|nr:multiple C2 and transmembrane domain-containing protein 1 isoform X2 [Hypomesus transpacificus]
MERGEWNEDEGSSHQNKLSKQFQAKTKLNLSLNLGSRETGEKRERGMWMFKRKKKRQHVLDRVISLSQPDLLCSAPVDLDREESPLCGKVNPSSGYSRNNSQAGAERMQSDAKTPISCMESKTPTVAYLVQSHHKSSSLGSACLERLSDEPATGNQAVALEEDDQLQGMSAHGASAVNSQRALPTSTLYKLDIDLKRGNNLAIRDRGGTSDPYVKFKLCGKEVFRSRIIHKNLNPVWEESTTLFVDNLHESLYVKVFDYDFGFQDDFIGSAYLYMESLEHHRTQPVILTLTDPHHPDQDLGTLELYVTLTPKDSPLEEHKDATTMLLRRSWKRSNKRQETQRLSEVHRKAQLWRGIVSISLIEGRDLVPMDPNGLSDPYAKFRLGPQKYKSKTMPKTLSPQWREQFDLHMYEETGGVLDISIWDKDTGRRDDFIGRCKLDLSTLVKEQTQRLELELEECRGVVVLLVTLTASSHVSIADLSFTPLDDPQERQLIARRYGVLRSFSNLRDVGIVQVKVMKAEGLMAADVTGKSDPFCVLELNNDRLQTHTVYKSLNPEWNKVFTFNVKDIHSVLEVTVFDEDRDRSADFLGKVAIPLLQFQDGEQKGYVLKNKKLTGPTKGVIYLEAEVIYNSVKAGLRTLVPAEQKYIEEESKLSKHLFQQNFNRVKRCAMVLINAGTYVNSCFEWESSQRSICAFLLFVVVVWNFELYMLPLALLLILAWNYCFTTSRGTEDMAADAMFEWEEEEEERDDKDFERKGFMGKLYAIQDVCITVQSGLDEVASYGERIKNVFNWTVPFLSCLAISSLCVATFLLYLVPLRYLVLTWGVNKFTKKLRDPYMIDNNELLDFLSRVPSDVQVVQYRQLKAEPGQSPNKRKRTNPG